MISTAFEFLFESATTAIDKALALAERSGSQGSHAQ